jgi:hypothetical protein
MVIVFLEERAPIEFRRRVLRLFQHLQRSVDGVAQVQRSGRTASEPACILAKAAQFDSCRAWA